MHTNTKNKIAFLQRHIKRHLTSWYKKYGENVTGIRVDKKRKGKKAKNYYSIVFNVVKKLNGNDLPAKQIIPKFFDINFPDGKRRKIKTDVRQTGEFNFHLRIMDPVRDEETGNPGALGLLLKDGRDNVYGLTNYHVAAEHLMQQQRFFYDVTQGDPRHDVSIGGSLGRLFKGTMEPELDVALVFLGSFISVSNALPDGRSVNNTGFIPGPIPPAARNSPVALYIPSRNGRFNRVIEDNEAPLNTRIMRFIELIMVKRCTRGGDSGSIVLAGNNLVLGIVLGADDEFTYIVPYYKIHKFFPLQII